jgi:hypothetical protein
MAEQTLHDSLESNAAALDGVRTLYEQWPKRGLHLLRPLIALIVLVGAMSVYHDHKSAQAGKAKIEAEKAIVAMKAEEEEIELIRSEQAPFVLSCSSRRTI